MEKDESSDSLDFTEVQRAKAAAPAVPRRKTPPGTGRDKPRGARKLVVPALIVVAIGVVAALAMREDEPAPPPAPAKPAPPASQTVPAPKPAQTYPPPTKLEPPPQTSAPSQASQLQNLRAMPPEFLKAVQEYNTKAGYKAMALALDSDGKWAYGSISGSAAQAGANEEALSECAKFKLKSGAQSSCRLFAVGDKVVW